MTRLGFIYLVSWIYLSAVICLSVSLNEHRAPGKIAREALRRWAKFMGLTIVIAAVVWLLD